jgi:hypothetical protein
MQIGTGGQDNYVKVVLSALNGPGGIQVVYEEDGTIVVTQDFAAADILTATSVDLFLDVETATGLVTPSWEYTTSGGQLMSGIGDPIAVSGDGDVLAAIQGTYLNQGSPSSLAVGAINTNANATSTIQASYDHFAVFSGSGTTTLASTTSSDGSLQLSSADDGTQPGGLPGKPAAIIAADDALKLDTTDVLLFHGNDFDLLQDLDPGLIANIKSGVAKGVLADVFDSVPGQGPPNDLFVFAQNEGSPSIGNVAVATAPDLSTLIQDDPTIV